MGQSERKESGGPSGRLMSLAALLPTVPEIRYLLARLRLRPPRRARFVMAWSLWRPGLFNAHWTPLYERLTVGSMAAIQRARAMFSAPLARAMLST
jgi:hypothetical protein